MPDLILVDVRLLGNDGFELTRRLKGAAEYASVPVILLTGHRKREVIVERHEAGTCNPGVKLFTPRS